MPKKYFRLQKPRLKLSLKKIISQKPSLLVGLVLILVLGSIGILTQTLKKDSKAAWWDGDYRYRTAYYFTATAVSAERKVKIDVDTATLITAGKVQSDCDDIRFTDNNGKLLDYFIDDSIAGCNDASTDFYLKFPTISSSHLVYMYYGNASVARSDIGGRKDNFFADANLGNLLQGYWKFNETSANGCVGGTDDNCDSAYSNGGASNLTNGTGRLGAAGLNLNGVDNDVNFSDIIDMSTSDFSYSIWFKTTDTDGDIANKEKGTDSGSFLLTLSGGAVVSTVYFNTVAYTITDTAIVNDNAWHFAVVSMDRDGNMTLYLDGANKGSVSIAAGSAFSGNHNCHMRLGTSSNANCTLEDATNAFGGSVDDFRVWKRVITQEEVTSMYNNNVSPAEIPTPITLTVSSGPTAASEETTPGPISHWKFDEHSGGNGFNTTYDSITGATATINLTSHFLRLSDDSCAVNNCVLPNGQNAAVTGTIGGIKTVGFWFRPGNGANTMITLATGVSISANTTNVTTTGITSPTIYVNGVQRSTYKSRSWNYVEVTTATAITGNAIVFSGQASLDEVKFYATTRTATEVKSDYNSYSSVVNKKNQTYLSDNLALYYRFNAETSLLDWKYSYGLANSAATNVSYVAGKFWQGASFNGTTAYAYHSDDTDTSITGSLAAAAWIKPSANTASTAYTIIGKWDGANESYLFEQYGDELRMYIDSSSNYQETTNLNLTTGVWYHVAAVYDSKTQNVDIYVNGREVASTTVGTIPSSIGDDASRIQVGAVSSSTTPVNFFNGIMDDVRLYRETKSPQEISNLYSWVPKYQTGWAFDYNSGTTTYNGGRWHNNSGGTHNFNGVLTNGPTIVPGKINTALSLDGSDDYVVFVQEIEEVCNITDAPLTISAWVKTTDTTGWILSRWYESGSNRCFAFGLDSSNVLKFLTSSSGSATTDTVTGSTVINDDKWHHVAVVKNGTTATIYVDGKIDGQSSTVPALLASGGSADRAIGAGVLDASNRQKAFAGLIDDVRIYRHILNHSQVAEIGNSSFVENKTSNSLATGYWAFDEQQGQTVNNKGLNGTISNGTLGADSSVASDDPTWKTKADCKINGCLSFDGTADYVDIANNAPDIDGQSFSISFWVKNLSASDSNYYYIGKGDESGTRAALHIGYDRTNQVVSFNFYGDDMSSTTAINNTNWHHLTFTYDSATNKKHIYVDGKLDGTATAGGSLSGTDDDNWEIGRRAWNNDIYFAGQMDEVKIYNSALTTDQVRADMNAGSSVSYSVLGASEAADLTDGAGNPPTLEMKLDENTGTTTNSTSGTFTGTLTNGPTWKFVTNQPAYGNGIGGGSVNFDGSDDFIDIGTGPTSVKSVALWVYPSTTTEYFVDLNGSAYIWANAGTVTATGFTSPTIYVNGRVSSTITANSWSHIEITTATGLNASDLDIGRLEGTDVLSGQIDNVVMYDYARTAAQVTYDFNRGKPMGHWKLDECQGSTVYDSSGIGNNGTITIGASGTQTSAGSCITSSTAWGNGTTGKFGSSLNFDGTDDYLDTGATVTELGIDTVTKPFTIAMWFKSTSSTADLVLIENYDGSPANSNIALRLDTGSLEVVISGSGGFTGASTFGSGYNDGNWHHAVVTWNGSSTVTAYIDGKRRGTASVSPSGSFESGSNFRIGQRPAGAIGYFPGQIDDVRIYNYTLSATQVRKVMNEGGSVRFGQ